MVKKKTTVISRSKIPITFLLDYFKEGFTIGDFLASYPWVKRREVERALDQLKNELKADSSNISL